MTKLISKIKIDDLTYFVLLFAFLSGRFQYVYILLITITIHEFGHLFMINIFNYKNSLINITFLGGITSYESRMDEPFIKETLICIMGPLFQLIFYLLVVLIKDYVPYNTFIIFKKINYVLFSFNLLPIYPLDGGKFFKIILDRILPYKISLFISGYFSLILCFIITIYFILIKDYLISILFVSIFLKVIKYIKERDVIYSKYLIDILNNDSFNV